MPSASRASARAVNPLQLVALFLAFLLIAAAGGVLTAGMLMPAVGSVGAMSAASVDLFDELPSELVVDEPSEQSVIYDAAGNKLATFFADNRIVVPLDAISQHVKDAVVATEDRRFYEHSGVDPEGMMRAAVTNAVSGSVEGGGSTLTQQYVKNVLIEESRVTGDTALYDAATESEGVDGYGRKLREARMAIGLEQAWTKDEILAGYLNIAQFGPSQYGVEAASRHYFNKPAAELNVGESAMIAGITQSPGKWDPVANPENALFRRNTVLGLMRNQNYITQAQYDEAIAVPIEAMLDVQTTPNGCGAAGTAAYFCEYVVKEILNNEAYGEDTTARRQLLLRGGLEIRTTLDPAKQQAAFDAVTGSIPVDDASGISMALSSIEPGTGHIFAMAQNTPYGRASEESPRATLVNYNVGQEHGGGSGFHSGSTFKVFTLIEWLRTGHSLMDRVNSANRDFPRESWNISCGNYATDYSPKNLEGFGGGVETVLESTRKSVNTSYVVMANQMDLCAITDVAAAMGVRNGAGLPLEPNPSAILGTNNTTPLSMANAYATLAAGGIMCEPVAITSMTDRSGEEIPVPPSNCQRVLEEDIANGVNHALQAVMGPEWDSTGSPARLPGRPTAGKTGTANDAKHAWFIGYIPQMATAVWMGYANGDEPMVGKTINGRWHESVYGGLISAPTWKAYMERATEGMPVVPFAEPDQRQIQGEQLRVPDVGGQSMADAQRTLEAAGFGVTVGRTVSAGYPAGTAAGTQPAAGSEQRRGTQVTVYPSSGTRSGSQQPSTGGGGNSGNGGGGNGGGGSGGGGGNDGESDDEASRGTARLVNPGTPADEGRWQDWFDDGRSGDDN
ncbi:transglycosylase domain-containing protein [Georgenia wangjunii]|uniref:transglycosylase domain-containing protein n=1 Tax=Georgenia wangjunii TaxID=3117730 RepID=UPI002F267B73